jgi:hypothetical protein
MNFQHNQHQEHSILIEWDQEKFPPIKWKTAPPLETLTFDYSEKKMKEKYIKSANNSHKKFIVAAKKLLF